MIINSRSVCGTKSCSRDRVAESSICRDCANGVAFSSLAFAVLSHPSPVVVSSPGTHMQESIYSRFGKQTAVVQESLYLICVVSNYL